MKLSHNNLDVVAWFIYIRSGQRGLIENGCFEASVFCKELIKSVLPLAFKNFRTNLSEQEKKFYDSLKADIYSDNFDFINMTLSSFIRKDHQKLDFSTLPEEVEIALKIFLNLKENACFPVGSLELNLFNEVNLKDFGVKKYFVDELLREYVGLDKSIYVAISGDGSPEIMSKLRRCLVKYTDSFTERELMVSNKGKRQWVRLQYAHESHWDERNMDHYMNHPYHGIRISGSSVGLIFFKKKNQYQNIRDLKEVVREELGFESFPHIHFPDTHREVRWMANASFNKNSYVWMNYALDEHPKNFTTLFPEYRLEMINREDPENFCLDTGIVMALHSIRDTADIDYISCGDTEKPIVNSRMESHNSQYEGYQKTPRDIIEDPNSHFFYKDIKFCSLNEIKELKKYRSELSKGSHNSKKDLKDIKLIEEYLKQNLNIQVIEKKETISKSKDTKNLVSVRKYLLDISAFFKRNIYELLKKIMPSFLRRNLRKIYISYLLRKKVKVFRKVPYILG